MTKQPLSPVRRDEAMAMWQNHAGARTDPAPPEEDPPVEQFGDHAALADELLDLVLSGTKRATAGLVADFAHRSEALPRIGGHWVAPHRQGLVAADRRQRLLGHGSPG